MDAPSPEKVLALKAQFPNRSLHEVTLVDGDKEYVFVMTGPARDEFKKFLREVNEARDNLEKGREAIERAALAQIRWPERETVREIFENHPAFPDQFGELVHKFAGSAVEVRAKNL